MECPVWRSVAFWGRHSQEVYHPVCQSPAQVWWTSFKQSTTGLSVLLLVVSQPVSSSVDHQFRLALVLSAWGMSCLWLVSLPWEVASNTEKCYSQTTHWGKFSLVILWGHWVCWVRTLHRCTHCPSRSNCHDGNVGRYWRSSIRCSLCRRFRGEDFHLRCWSCRQ